MGIKGFESLSKKEKRYQFIYLLLMLIITVSGLCFIVLRDYKSPFSNASILEIQMLEQKNKFSEQEKLIEPLLESTFRKISILKFETPQPYAENEIVNNINEIANSFYNVKVYDARIEAYLQIAQFYKMYFEDKKIAARKTENIKLFQKQFEECSIGFKDKEQQLSSRKNALLSR